MDGFLSDSPASSWRVAAAVRSLVALAMLGALLLGVSPARGEEELVFKPGQFHEGEWLHVSVGFRELFNTELKRQLQSGFTTTVVMRVYLYRRGGGPPVSLAVRTLRAVYDLWEERYLLRIEEQGSSRTLRLDDQRAVVDRLTSLWRFPLVKGGFMQPTTPYFVGVIAEVNPVSEELLAEVRRWLRSPYESHRQMNGESFFGSFVSIFVNNRIRRAERTLRLRTQTFYRRQ